MSLSTGSQKVHRRDALPHDRGRQLPFLLHAMGAHYVLIGEAYVDGVVDREAVGEHGEADEGFKIW